MELDIDIDYIDGNRAQQLKSIRFENSVCTIFSWLNLVV